MKRFTDFAEEHTLLEGEKVRISEILDTEIMITGAKINQSKFKDNSDKYLKLQFQRTSEAEKEIIFTGSKVLIEQIEKYKQEIPFWATIKKINRYYTLT